MFRRDPVSLRVWLLALLTGASLVACGGGERIIETIALEGGGALLVHPGSVVRVDDRGEALWRAATGDARPEPSGGALVVTDGEGELRVLDLETGEPRASASASAACPGGLVLDDLLAVAHLGEGCRSRLELTRLGEGEASPPIEGLAGCLRHGVVEEKRARVLVECGGALAVHTLDLERGRLLQTLEAPEGAVRACVHEGAIFWAGAHGVQRVDGRGVGYWRWPEADAPGDALALLACGVIEEVPTLLIRGEGLSLVRLVDPVVADLVAFASPDGLEVSLPDAWAIEGLLEGEPRVVPLALSEDGAVGEVGLFELSSGALRARHALGADETLVRAEGAYALLDAEAGRTRILDARGGALLHRVRGPSGLGLVAAAGGGFFAYAGPHLAFVGERSEIYEVLRGRPWLEPGGP